MTKSTHTPYYLSEQTYSRENGRAIQGTCITARTAGEPLEIIFCSLGMSHEDVKEKSAFIVKAVNCHDDLIKTVNDLIECICSVPTANYFNHELGEARNLLEKAGVQ